MRSGFLVFRSRIIPQVQREKQLPPP